MAITASDVNKLRQATGAGMMDCKKALEETQGDFEAAIDNLRKKGQKVSAKRADREANEGVVIAKTNDDNTKGIIVKITSETDFVAKNADFIAFADQIANIAIQNLPADAEALKGMDLNGQTISNRLDEQVAKIGEKIELGDYILMDAASVVAYNHAGNRIGVLVGMNQPASDKVIEAGKDVAMQVAAMNPVALNKEGVDKTTIERELEIAREQIRAEGKPENMVDKIAEGKLNKFFKESTLLSQMFVKDPSKTVADILKGIDSNLTVVEFKRVALGE